MIAGWLAETKKSRFNCTFVPSPLTGMLESFPQAQAGALFSVPVAQELCPFV